MHAHKVRRRREESCTKLRGHNFTKFWRHCR